jgi:hypothetical protein
MPAENSVELLRPCNITLGGICMESTNCKVSSDFLAEPKTTIKTVLNHFEDRKLSPVLIESSESTPNSTNVPIKSIPDYRYLERQPKYTSVSPVRKIFSRSPGHFYRHGNSKRNVFGSIILKFLFSIVRILFKGKHIHDTRIEAKKPVSEIKLIGPPSTLNKQPIDSPTPLTKASVNPTSNRLPNLKAKNYHSANINLIMKQIAGWSITGNPYTPEEMSLLKKIANIFSDAWHTSLPTDEALVLTSYNFSTIVTVIRSLRKKVGLAELAVAILIALVIEHRLYSKHCRTLSGFFRLHGEIMGLSPSGIRDYYKRGIVFLKYREDILEGIDEIPGIPLDEFVGQHMAKLTLYERAVEEFGRKEALCNLRLTFREFQKKLSAKNPQNKKTFSALQKKSPATNTVSSQEIHEAQKNMILALDLKPNEKRLLQIIAKNGIVYSIEKLTEEQLALLEIRLRQHRVQIFERNLKLVLRGVQYKPIDLVNPLLISDELYRLTNISEIILRIRTGLALIAPVRRTIAILTFRLFSEKLTFESQWKHPRKGIVYSSFRDFAMDELGLGEDYRNYIAVGQVLKDYYYFLDGFSEIDTEAVFLKLRYLPKALKTHKENEPLVLARLRSLTVREFKLFSEEPDFEITFSKRLTQKQLDKFTERARPFFKRNGSLDFIEIYQETEYVFVEKIVREIIEETKSSENLNPHDLTNETSNVRIHSDVDDFHQVLNSSTTPNVKGRT